MKQEFQKIFWQTMEHFRMSFFLGVHLNSSVEVFYE